MPAPEPASPRSPISSKRIEERFRAGRSSLAVRPSRAKHGVSGNLPRARMPGRVPARWPRWARQDTSQHTSELNRQRRTRGVGAGRKRHRAGLFLRPTLADKGLSAKLPAHRVSSGEVRAAQCTRADIPACKSISRRCAAPVGKPIERHREPDNTSFVRCKGRNRRGHRLVAMRSLSFTT
jgi:hypothetical protein